MDYVSVWDDSREDNLVEVALLISKSTYRRDHQFKLRYRHRALPKSSHALSVPLSCEWPVSLNQFKLPGLPGLIEPRLQGTIKAQEDTLTFAWNSLHPIGLMPLRRCGAEPNIYRCVRVHDDILFLAADAGELFIGLQHRSGLIVIDDE